MHTHRYAIHRLLLVLAAALGLLAAAAPAALAEGTLTVTKSPIPEAGVVSALEGIECGDDCTERYEDFERCTPPPESDCGPVPQTVVLRATPAAGWAFSHWSGCVLPTGSCRVTMTGDKPVRATFTDIADPTVAMSGPVAGSEIGPATPFGATAGDNHRVARVEFLVKGQRFATDESGPDYSATLDTAKLPDGTPIANGSTVDITVRSVDPAERTASETRRYVVDNAVSADFNEVPDSFTNDAAPRVVFDGDSDVVSWRCVTYRGATHLETRDPCPTTYVPPTAVDGVYDVRVTATDDAGNTHQIGDAFTVDRRDPAVAIAAPTDGEVIGRRLAVDYNVSDANRDVTNEKCSVAGGPFGACGRAAPPDHDGTYTLEVRAVDKAGNVGEDTVGFRVDNTPPALRFTAAPPDVVKTRDATFAFEAPDASPVNVRCKLDDGPLATCASPHVLRGLAEGPHVFTVHAADVVGNESSISRTFVVDAVRPTVEIVDGPSEGLVTAATSVRLRFQATDAVRAECSLDSPTAFVPCAAADAHQLSGLRDGPHVFRVRVSDLAGGEATAQRSFRVDTSRPETRIDAGPAEGAALPDTAVTFAFSASDAGATFRCRLVTPGSGAPFGPCSGPGNTHGAAGLGEGTYVFEVVATNALGTPDATPARRTFTLIKAPPPGIQARVSTFWKVFRRGTQVRTLTVTDVPEAATVRVSCASKRKGCPFKARTAKAKGGTAKLARLFPRRLKPGARIVIRVTMPGAVGRQFVYTVRKGAFPRKQERCLPAGGGKPTAC